MKMTTNALVALKEHAKNLGIGYAKCAIVRGDAVCAFNVTEARAREIVESYGNGAEIIHYYGEKGEDPMSGLNRILHGHDAVAHRNGFCAHPAIEAGR